MIPYIDKAGDNIQASFTVYAEKFGRSDCELAKWNIWAEIDSSAGVVQRMRET